MSRLHYLYILGLLGLVPRQAAVAATSPNVPKLTLVKPVGPFAFVEWNPADLLHDRIRINSEYVVIDGFAFGFETEFELQKRDDWKHTKAGVAVTATQYFESQSLRGTFLKGSAGAFGTSYETKLQKNSRNALTVEKGSVFGLGLGIDAGYRFVLTPYLTGAAAYGIRRNVPGFFSGQESEVSEVYSANQDLWDVRVQVSLGLAF